MNSTSHSPSPGRWAEPSRPPGTSDAGAQGKPELQTHVQCRICRHWYQAITYTHLKYKHGIERPEEYKEEYSLPKIVSAEVRQRIADQKFVVDAVAVDYIRSAWGKQSLKEITSYLGINASTIRAHAKRLGLGLLVEKWDPRKILRSLRRAHREGMPLSSGEARKRLGQLYKASIQYFRTWKNALTKAGISYAKVARREPFESWTAKRIISELKELHRRGKDKDYSYIQARHYKLYAAARNHFGNWRNARWAAGLSRKKGTH